MYKIVLLVWSLLSITAVQAQTTNCAQHYFEGKPPVVVNEKLLSKAKEVCKSEYASFHSGLTRTPLYVAEELNRNQLLDAKGLERRNDFHSEGTLPPADRAELADYARSGYDRGHLAPSADFPDAQAQRESFSLANIVPQDPSNNREIWAGIEMTVRNLVKAEGTMYVVTGVMFKGEKLKQIGGRVLVPSHLWKLVINPRTRKASAYLVENIPTKEYKVISVEKLNELTGITFANMDPLQLPAPKKGRK